MMAYQIYLDETLFPMAPSKISLKVKGQNKTINLINGEEVNILNPAGLTEISLDLLLPSQNYPFAEYERGYRSAEYFLEILEALKTEQRPFRFLCVREGRFNTMFDTNIAVSLEDYTVSEDAKDGRDITASITLKQYVSCGTIMITLKEPESSAGEAMTEEPRETEGAPQASSYTVKKGDCLWNIAKKLLGNGARYTEIYDLNRNQISNPNLIYPGQVLAIPA